MSMTNNTGAEDVKVIGWWMVTIGGFGSFISPPEGLLLVVVGAIAYTLAWKASRPS